MFIREFRIVMPMTADEYQIGQLFSLTEAAQQETGGGEGVEVLRNEPFDGENLFHGEYTTGQFTHKIYHLNTKVPAILRAFAPTGSLKLHEKSWNAYPYSLTEVTNPDYMGDNFSVRIESLHLNDRGTTRNVFRLTQEEQDNREVVKIDIANDGEYLNASDIRDDTRPSTFHSERTGRGPLLNSWRRSHEPVMCAYKLVTFNFKKFGAQYIVESYAKNQYPRMFCKFNREVFCSMDRWHGLTLAEIRIIEERVRRELDEARARGAPRGMNP